jgi:hypothetical protein
MKRNLILTAAAFSIAAASFGANAQGDNPVFEPQAWKRANAVNLAPQPTQANPAYYAERANGQTDGRVRLADPFAPALSAQ